MKVQKNFAMQYVRTRLNVLYAVNKQKAAEEAFRMFCTPLTKAVNNHDSFFKKCEGLSFRMNGRMVHGYRFNHSGKKKALMLHGFSSASYNFKHFIEQLAEKNYEVFAFDAPGHGKSEGTSITAPEYAQMIAEVHAQYGPFDSFICHSFGGIALSLALEKIPHTVDTKVVFIAPATETTTALDSAFAFLSLNNPGLRKAIDDHILKISGKDISWFSIRRSIKNIKASVLWFHDEDDVITPVADAKRVAADAPANVKFVFTKGLGHSRIYQDPGVNEKVFAFL